ncbi:hypothetical protein CORC01_09900 [Colletotrichum orchidophilum]|uniref:DUF7136 domain-containing protein n=1 Tax=Colletotrichum orchidophilum TaxID=1209926 RepID=A0A1G4B0D2_9PEZI|nr:uncharacterized protein CORC01_09900 [Colletotrichum orchidophilum]OHE94793.1 hypothetical protein CORC01_09900 [Colletotrichum orchidophilum]
MHVLSWTSRWSLLACVWTILGAAAASDNSGIVEVDLVFPRNDTYAPTPLLPIIFGFQNSPLAPALAPQITFSIWNYDNKSDAVDTTAYDVRWANFSSSDPYFEYRGFVDFNVEKTWEIRYTVRWFSCTKDSLEYPYDITSNNTYKSVVFTTKNAGQSVDLVAATNEKGCSSDAGVAISVTDTLNATGISSWTGGDTCAVVASSTVTPNPCQIKISEAEASSISASVTARACEAQNPPIECPAGNEGHGLVVGGVGSKLHLFDPSDVFRLGNSDAARAG